MSAMPLALWRGNSVILWRLVCESESACASTHSCLKDVAEISLSWNDSWQSSEFPNLRLSEGYTVDMQLSLFVACSMDSRVLCDVSAAMGCVVVLNSGIDHESERNAAPA